MKYLVLYLLGFPIVLQGAVSPKETALRSRMKQTLQKALMDPVRLEIQSPPVPSVVPEDAQLVLQGSSPPFGMVRMNWQWADGGQMHKVPTHAVVKGFSKVAVAKRPITQGSLFSKEDLNFVEKEVSRFGISGYYASWGDLKGLVASQYIRPGETLGAGNTVKPYDVSRGQQSQVVSQNGGIRISARVQALQNGRSGDWIQVRNTQTQKVFSARVAGPGELRID